MAARLSYIHVGGRLAAAVRCTVDKSKSLDEVLGPIRELWDELDNFHVSSKIVGAYRVTVAGPHTSTEVISLFSSKTRN